MNKSQEDNAPQAPPHRSRLRDRPRPAGLHRLQRRWDIGRIYETRGGPEHLRWFWSFAVQGPMTHSNRVATFEEAKAQFQKSWDAWLKWANLNETE